MKYIILASVVLLTACKTGGGQNTPYVQYQVEAEGCVVKYIENPKGYNFFIAKCPSESETITHVHSSGKTTRTEATVVTSDDLRKQLSQVEAKEKALAKLTDEEKKLVGLK